jgi:uncharacterized membrane protein
MTKYIYWGTTVLLALLMLASGVMYFTADSMADNFARLGFPAYFRIELGVAKVLGAAALVAPLPRALKEWTYAGFTISFVSAIIAHTAVGDPLSAVAPPVVALALLVASYVTYRQHVLEADPMQAAEQDAAT